MKACRLFLSPPLAVARLGDSPDPLFSFEFAANDLRPEGTGKTTLALTTTFSVDGQGNVTEVRPDPEFRDGQGRIKPVAVFFELRYQDSGNSKLAPVPVTLAVLNEWRVKPEQLEWSVQVANLKAYHYTRDPGTRVEAQISLTWDDTAPHVLEGHAPFGTRNPLVPAKRFIPLGTVQLTRPRHDHDCFRLYFKPATGQVYGPTNLAERKFAESGEGRPSALRLPAENLILNPRSSWCQMQSPKGGAGADPRTIPPGLFATDEKNVSLGLMDDICDGIITCRINGEQARARIFVGPPDEAPDRRHFSTLADGLNDREGDFADYQDPGWKAEVRDLLERVWETAGLINVDFCNTDVPAELNVYHSFIASQPIPVPPDPPLKLREADGFGALPLTNQAREMHRRLAFPESFEALLLEHPELLESHLRRPDDTNLLFDHRMPALMRGQTGKALTLTRRQYQMLLTFARRFAGKMPAGK